VIIEKFSTKYFQQAFDFGFYNIFVIDFEDSIYERDFLKKYILMQEVFDKLQEEDFIIFITLCDHLKVHSLKKLIKRKGWKKKKTLKKIINLTGINLSN